MFDPQKILGQVLGGGGEGQRKGGFSGDLLKGGALGGLAGLMLGTKAGRKIGGSALNVGGMAVLGGLAYKAWTNWEAQQQGQTARVEDAATAAEGTVFLPSQQAERDDLSAVLLSAMIAAAKSDGHIDAEEQTRIFSKLGESDLDPEEKGFLMDQLRKPLDLDALAAKATTPERAVEIYAASVLAVNADNPAEVDYLNKLASRLNLDMGLRASVETELKSAVAVPA